MDPISVSTLVGLITQSAAGEAGKSAWEGLAGLARRVFDRPNDGAAALERAKEGDQDSALDLAGLLVQRAAADPHFAGLLRIWMIQTHQAGASGSLTNAIGGNARIRGNVVQARDIGTVRPAADSRGQLKPNTEGQG